MFVFSRHRLLRETCRHRNWRPFVSVRQSHRPPEVRRLPQVELRPCPNRWPAVSHSTTRLCATPGGRMHFGPAIHAFGREPPLSTGQRLWTDARFVHSGASVSQESKPQGDWTDAGQPMGEGGRELWTSMVQSTFTFLTAAALVLLGALFNTASVALAEATPTGLMTPSLGFITEEASLKSAVAPPGLEDLTPEEQRTVKLFLDNTPSVVNISNLVNAKYGPYSMAEQLPQGQGSGFIWDTNGHVVTNFHVIRGANAIKVTLIDSNTYTAKLLGGDPDKDVAVLKLQAPDSVLSDLKPITLGTSANLQVGQRVFAVGNPFGLDHSMSQGIISGLGRELAVPTLRQIPIKNVIQTDAAINPGNSGGVLLDSRGRLIGINTAIADPSGKGASSGVGFAIPIDTVKGLVDQVLQYGKIVRPVLGISIAPPQTLRQQQMEGVLILEVQPSSPAAQAGLRGTFRNEFGSMQLGDVIVGLQGKPIKLQKDLFATLDECRPGDKVELDVIRDGKKMRVDVVLGGRDLVPVGE